MDGYTSLVLENPELNAAILQKGSQDLRLDAMVETSPSTLANAFKEHEKYDKWFVSNQEWTCLGVHVLDQTPTYCMTFQKKAQKIDFVYRRFFTQDNDKSTLVLQGLLD